jgi:hypothetical protein
MEGDLASFLPSVQKRGEVQEVFPRLRLFALSRSFISSLQHRSHGVGRVRYSNMKGLLVLTGLLMAALCQGETSHPSQSAW